MKVQFKTVIFSILFIGISNSFSQHTHEQKASTARNDWGDFAEGELIKMYPVDYTTTPIYKHISKAGELRPSFRYLDSVSIHSMVYDSDSLMVTGFLVRPLREGNYPCIIYNRGGNRDIGALLVANAVQEMAMLASKGFIVIASNYRGNSNSEGKEEFGGSDLNDVLNLIPALGQVEGADTRRIGMLGISRGGMMTYLAMKHSNHIDAAVVIGGMANLFTMKEHRPEMEDHVYAQLIPEYSTNKEETLIDRSVVYWADSLCKKTKLLILHGTNDDRVSIEEASELADSLSVNNHPYKFVSFKGDNHGVTKHRTEVFNLIENWFDAFVMNDQEYSIDSKQIVMD